jgi:hypothetical protein
MLFDAQPPRRCGAAVENLSDNAFLQSIEEIIRSNAGTKTPRPKEMGQQIFEKIHCFGDIGSKQEKLEQ